MSPVGEYAARLGEGEGERERRAAPASAWTVRRVVVFLWKAAPGLSALIVAAGVFTALASPAIAYTGKQIIDAVTAGRPRGAVAWVLVEVLLVLLQTASGRAISSARGVLTSSIDVALTQARLAHTLALELAEAESPAFQDRLARGRGPTASRLVGLYCDALLAAQCLLALAIYGALLSRLGFLVFLAVATVPAMLLEAKEGRRAAALEGARAEEQRYAEHLEATCTGEPHAKEVRILGIGAVLAKRVVAITGRFHAEERARALRSTAISTGALLIAPLTFYGCYAAVAYSTATHQASLGELMLYVVSFDGAQRMFSALVTALKSAQETAHRVAEPFSTFLLSEGSTAPSQARLEPCPASRGVAERGFVLENVGFRYPGRERWALRHVDLRIGPSECVALMGGNGSGKTTLIKLLAGLYAPTEGSLRLDGVPLSSWPSARLRARFAVLFQDFARFELVLRENVGLGMSEPLVDADVLAALEASQALDLVARLPEGLDTLLGHLRRGSTELSGGQWQKVALARLFLRGGADIVLLDEPTAALDSAAEQAIFERVRKLRGDRTVLFISHRPASARLADRVIILREGRLVEDAAPSAGANGLTPPVRPTFV